MKVAICDDESGFLDELELKLRKYSNEKSINIQIERFDSGNKFLNVYTEHKDFDIIFLDIQMPGINGIELAKILRKNNDKVSIVFTTSLIQYALDGYRVCAMRYLMKPLAYSKLKRELDEIVLAVAEASANFIVIKNDNGVYKIFFEDILFIETSGRNTMVHLKSNEEILSYKTLKYYEQQLDYRFFRCHSGYLVNMEQISKVEKFNIELLNQAVIPLSKNRKRDFSQKLAAFYGDLI